MRPLIEARSGGACECGCAAGRPRRIHHRLRRSQGGTNDLDNLAHLAHVCHTAAFTPAPPSPTPNGMLPEEDTMSYDTLRLTRRPTA